MTEDTTVTAELKVSMLTGCLMLLATPFMSVAVSALDALVIVKLASWFTVWEVTFATAFFLSLVSGLLCHQYIKTDPNDDLWTAYFTRVIYAILAPLAVLVSAYIAHFWFGI